MSTAKRGVFVLGGWSFGLPGYFYGPLLVMGEILKNYFHKY